MHWIKSKLQAGWIMLKLTAKEWWKDETLRLSAALAFYTMFSIAPILLAAVAIAGFFVPADTASEQVVKEVESMVGPQGSFAAREVIAASANLGNNVWAIVIGVVGFLFGASVVFAELQIALNKVWDVKAEPKRGIVLRFLLNRVRSFGFALEIGFLLLVSLVISAGVDIMQARLDAWAPGIPWAWQLLNTVGTFAVVSLLFAMIYKYLPDVEIVWADVWIGAAVTAGLFMIGKQLITEYLARTAAAADFGAAGSLAVILLWVYYSAAICFFGAEFTHVYAIRHGSQIRPNEHARRVGQKPDEQYKTDLEEPSSTREQTG